MKTQALLRRLRQLTGPVASVRHHLRAVQVDAPTLMVVLAGEKRVLAGEQTWRCTVGEAVMVHQPLALDVENVPARGRDYRAVIVSFEWRLVELARGLLLAHGAVLPTKHVVDTLPVDELAGSLSALVAREALNPGPARDLALVHVLLTLVRRGYSGFLRGPSVSVSARVRELVATAPARRWTSPQVEGALSMSGATLRRRLAREGASLRGLILEARLHQALGLLQTSREPLKSIAFACGYRSRRRFGAAFQARFGVAPSIFR